MVASVAQETLDEYIAKNIKSNETFLSGLDHQQSFSSIQTTLANFASLSAPIREVIIQIYIPFARTALSEKLKEKIPISVRKFDEFNQTVRQDLQKLDGLYQSTESFSILLMDIEEEFLKLVKREMLRYTKEALSDTSYTSVDSKEVFPGMLVF